jgi:hypothetical protein
MEMSEDIDTVYWKMVLWKNSFDNQGYSSERSVVSFMVLIFVGQFGEDQDGHR